MEADNYEVFTLVASEAPKPLFGDADVASSAKIQTKH